jgi:SET domain-containing protein|tara:strand:+ start:970 stop:1359 length:390 start_codon:yes stop_codon:yes gene_type:complete
MKLIPPSKVEIKDSPGKGLGVFSMKKIFKGEIIEECPLFTLKKGETIKEFHNYVFNYPQGFTNTEIVLPWGFGCIYNHSDDNNAYWRDHPKYKAFQFIANRDIEVGEEVCTYYGDEDYYWDKRKQITKI